MGLNDGVVTAPGWAWLVLGVFIWCYCIFGGKLLAKFLVRGVPGGIVFEAIRDPRVWGLPLSVSWHTVVRRCARCDDKIWYRSLEVSLLCLHARVLVPTRRPEEG